MSLEPETSIAERSRPERLEDERRTAFTELADRHLDSSYRLAALILRDPTEAQDATHDAFMAAWRSWGSLRDPSRFDAWFGRILVNVCRDRLRRRSRTATVVDISAAIATHGSERDPAAAAGDRDEMERAFAALDPERRIVIVLRFYADLTVEQVAERVGIPAGTVKSRLHHGLRDLARELDSATARENR